VVDLVLRLLTAGALAVSAYVHADLAPLYDPVRASVSQGNLFRIDAEAAALAALIVLAVGRRTGSVLPSWSPPARWPRSCSTGT
jgi:hypothetical protein